MICDNTQKLDVSMIIVYKYCVMLWIFDINLNCDIVYYLINKK